MSEIANTIVRKSHLSREELERRLESFDTLEVRWKRRVKAHQKMARKAEREKMSIAASNNLCVVSAVNLCIKELREHRESRL